MSPELRALERIERRVVGLEKKAVQLSEVWLSADEVYAKYKFKKKTLYRRRKDNSIHRDDWRAAGRNNIQYRETAIIKLFK